MGCGAMCCAMCVWCHVCVVPCVCVCVWCHVCVCVVPCVCVVVCVCGVCVVCVLWCVCVNVYGLCDITAPMSPSEGTMHLLFCFM